MDTVICDTTAFDCWRIPPVVHLLVAGEEDNPVLRELVSHEELMAFRASLVSSLPLCKTLLMPNPHLRHVGEATKSLAVLAPQIGAGHAGPVDILVRSQKQCHASETVKTRLWTGDLPFGVAELIYEDVYVTNPEMTLLQLAGRASLVRTLLLASEMCGSFSVYRSPAPMRDLLQRIGNRCAQARRPFPIIGGWSPCFTSDGRLSDLWSRLPLTTPHDLKTFAEAVKGRCGCARLLQVADLVKPDAASPFEVQTGLLLGLPKRRGGEGMDSFRFNEKVTLTPGARLLAQKQHCYCDLYWDKGLDLECQSALIHQNEASYLSDSERAAALKSMGIDVLPVTFAQVSDEARFEALADAAAKMLGIRPVKKSDRQKAASKELRREIFVDWGAIQRI